jgi:hypothetical protein
MPVTPAMRVASVCMPDPLKRPEPFWCLQAKDGSCYAQLHPTGGEIVIPLVQCVLLRNEKSFVIVAQDVAELGFVAIPQTAQQVKERHVDPVRAVASAGAVAAPGS